MPPNAPPTGQTGGKLMKAKVGPVPVWLIGAVGLGAAVWWNRHEAAKNAATSTTATSTTAAGEPAGTSPAFIIENNLPSVGTPSAPVAPITTTPVTVTPPGTGPNPPINGAPAQPTTGTAKAPTTTATAKATSYTVHSGDTLSSIAAANGTTWQKLWAYNTTPGNRPAATIATLKSRGPDLLYSGETVLIPPK